MSCIDNSRMRPRRNCYRSSMTAVLPRGLHRCVHRCGAGWHRRSGAPLLPLLPQLLLPLLLLLLLLPLLPQRPTRQQRVLWSQKIKQCAR